MTHDRSFLEAALIGYGHQLALIGQAMAELRRRIGSTPPPPAKRTKRFLSVAARARIAAAQRKRWAELKSAAKAPPKKRKLSAAARKRIAEANRKRWAAFRAAKATPAKKAVPAKKTARRKNSPAANKAKKPVARKSIAPQATRTGAPPVEQTTTA
jgi:hypothetical protein